jgi:hypothetical protein
MEAWGEKVYFASMAQTDHDKPQADKFRDMARDLEADEDEARFEEAARKIATAPVPSKESKLAP